MNDIIFWSIWAVLGIIMLIFYGRTKKPFKNALIGMILGGIALVGVHFVGDGIGISLTLNLFNTMVSLILGIPGVVMLVVLNVFI